MQNNNLRGAPPKQFNDKVVIITGGSSGIGAATALLFAASKAKIYNLDIAKPAYENNFISWLQCDVSDSVNVKNSIATVLEYESRIDYLFVNAGIYIESFLQTMDDAAIEQLMATNINGAIFTLRAVLPFMRKERSGSVVLMGSDQSFLGRSKSALYGATKGAIAQLTKALALECAEDNVHVNAVCPGAIMTPMMQRAMQQEAECRKVSEEVIANEILATIPLGRFGKPEDVAQVVAFLCSDAAAFITGTLIGIDGGVVAGGRS